MDKLKGMFGSAVDKGEAAAEAAVAKTATSVGASPAMVDTAKETIHKVRTLASHSAGVGVVTLFRRRI